MPGKVVHFEIPADDIERAKSFYKKAFGWQANPVPGMDYTMLGTAPSDKNGMPTEPGAINGGMLVRQNPVKNPVITIQVEEIEAALKNITRLGGTIVRKKEPVGDMGFTAYFKDTEGNIVGLYQVAQRQ
jgi:predicted enzyme related to lactoylglutathione lyase